MHGEALAIFKFQKQGTWTGARSLESDPSSGRLTWSCPSPTNGFHEGKTLRLHLFRSPPRQHSSMHLTGSKAGGPEFLKPLKLSGFLSTAIYSLIRPYPSGDLIMDQRDQKCLGHLELQISESQSL